MNFMSLCQGSTELDIFETTTLSELIQFKWQTYGRRHHFFGYSMHIVYVTILVMYINVVYIKNTGTDDDKKLYAYLLGCGMLYPLIYEAR